MANEAQIEHWNGPASQKWVAHADALDAMLQPFADAVLAEAKLMPGECVLDVGCGAGALGLAAKRDVGETGCVTGVDVSRPLLDLAEHRAQAAGLDVAFERADAGAYRAEKPVDRAVSRFGVMFFEDPVAAFRSLRRNLRPEGRLVFACWQDLRANAWAGLPLLTARPFLTQMPDPPPKGAPGPFAFADPGHVRAVLEGAGWRGVETAPWTGQITLPGQDADETAGFMLELGPLSRMLADAGAPFDKISKALRDTLARHDDGAGRIRLDAAAWIVSATAS